MRSAAKWSALRCRCMASCRKSGTTQRHFSRHQCIVQGHALSFAVSSATACRCDSAPSPRRRTADAAMGLAHKRLPTHGVQFHPESIASDHGHLLLKNFLDIAAAWNFDRTARRRPTAPSLPSPACGEERRGARVILRAAPSGGAHRQGCDRRRARPCAGSGRRLRADDGGRSDAVADGRAPDGVAGARRDRRRNHRRRHRDAGENAAGRGRRRCCSAPAATPRARSVSTCAALIVAPAIRSPSTELRAVVEIRRGRRAGRARRQYRPQSRADRLLHPRSRHRLHVCPVASPGDEERRADLADAGTRTIFNSLGSLSNPAGVKRQMVGVFSKHWTEPSAQVLKNSAPKSVWWCMAPTGSTKSRRRDHDQRRRA